MGKFDPQVEKADTATSEVVTNPPESKSADKAEETVAEDTPTTPSTPITEHIEILEEGWLGEDGTADLSKVKDEALKGYIEGLIKKASVVESTEHGFNPTAPQGTKGYLPGMSFEDALSLE